MSKFFDVSLSDLLGVHLATEQTKKQNQLAAATAQTVAPEPVPVTVNPRGESSKPSKEVNTDYKKYAMYGGGALAFGVLAIAAYKWVK